MLLTAFDLIVPTFMVKIALHRPNETAIDGADAGTAAGLDDSQQSEYRFYLREKLNETVWSEALNADPQVIRDYFYRFLYQPRDREYPDLCQLPDLNEETLMDNLRARFQAGHIYTYVGSILIAVNPFKFYPIYNPKYVKLYQNRRLGELPPHIFAVADAAYNAMMRDRKPQCIVISGNDSLLSYRLQLSSFVELLLLLLLFVFCSVVLS
jgi:myosin-9